MNIRKSLYCCTVAWFALAPTAFVLAGDKPFIQQTDLKVPMSDGVKLAADVYLPSTGKKFPTVVIRTPYGRGGMGFIAEPLAKHGYSVVVQDARGQGGSEGTFIPFIFEKQDGLDTLAWVAKQSWCDGNIGMWGPSYLGYCALVVSPENPEGLKAIVNISGWGDTGLMTTPGGALHLMVALPWTLSGQIRGRGSMEDFEWPEVFRRTPVTQIPKSMGIDSAQWEGAVQMYTDEVMIESASITGRYDSIKVPTFHITGWYDFVSPSTIDAYEGLDQASRAGSGTPRKLLVGPWRHDQIWTEITEVGEEDFGRSSIMGIDKVVEECIEWFDHWLKGVDNGILEEEPVRLFVMGENKWKTFDQWPPRKATSQKWYFGSDKGANGVSGDGRLALSVLQKPGQDRFVYDPMNPVPTTGGANSHFFLDNIGVMNQQEVEKRDDVLVYTSEVLLEDMTIIGPIGAVLYASTDGRQTAFTAKLVEVRSDGYARNIIDGIKRGPDPIDGKDVALMEPGKVYRFSVDMEATAITIRRGHRLRVEVSSSNFPKYTRNPNTGESPESASEFKKATQTILHSTEHPSHVVLPVLN